MAVDRAALPRAVDRLADRVDRAPVEGAVRLDGHRGPAGARPSTGCGSQRRAAADALADAYLDPRPDRTGRAAHRGRRPAIGQQAVDRAVAEVAEPAVSAPVALTVEGTTVQLPPEAIGGGAGLRADGDGEPACRGCDGERLHAAVADELAPVEDPARDASFDIVDGRPQVVPSQQGREVLPASLAAAVLPVLTETGPARAATVALEVERAGGVDRAGAVARGGREGVGVHHLLPVGLPAAG